jgi:aspartokinase
MEIVASYWEPKIKTYGFQKMVDLSLVEVTPGTDGMESLGLALHSLGEEGIDFQLVFSSSAPEKSGRCFFLTGRSGLEKLSELKRQDRAGADKGSFRVVSSVELVLFQGPHYGDRFGVADASLRALATEGLGVLATVCTGSCVYLVVPEGTAEGVVSALSESFDVPRAVRRDQGKFPGHREHEE